jgi:hypothetical protein
MATSEHKLNGSPFTTTFNGTDYVWEQKARAEQRKIRQALSHIVALMSSINQASDAQQATLAIEFSNAMCEFCEAYHDKWFEDADEIEDYLRDAGARAVTELTNDVFMPIFNNWLEPWMSSPKKEKKGRAKKK